MLRRGTTQKPLALVVDGDETFRLLARETLEKSAFSVVDATTGGEALAWCDAMRPDLVILDVSLEDMPGHDVCLELRERFGDELVPILMVSGSDDPEAIYRGYNRGATDFLPKPLDWMLLSHRCLHLIRASRAQTELRQSRATLATAQRIARLGSLEWDVVNDQMSWSEESFRILGLDQTASSPSPRAFFERIHPADRVRVHDVMKEAWVDKKSFTTEFRVQLPGGEIRHVRQHGDAGVEVPGGDDWLATAIQDVTEHARAMDKIRYLANYDGLTGLSNRRLFRLQLRDAIGRAEERDEMVGLLFMDLDRFKRINDTLGHTVGDQLLQAVADRILDRVRGSDSVARGSADEDAETEKDGKDAVSRLGGDEFTVVLPRISTPEDAGMVAQRILSTLPIPIHVEDQTVTVNASIGIAIYPLDGTDPETLIKHADVAMYHAKARGGNNYQFFLEAMNLNSIRNLTLETRLNEALERDELLLHFQPKLDSASGEITGMEALVRWNHPEMGMVAPGEFIPLAEESGLIVPIGKWVIETACAQNKAWQDEGLRKVPIAVNVSSRQFANRRLRDTVVEALRQSGLEPSYLELEITESVMMDDGDASVATLEELKQVGVKVALDDFGTGFSSLSYLKRLPLDSLKIDRTFVCDVPGEPDAEGIVLAIIAMAHVLHLRVVAEGVETEEQAAFLANERCDEMQGYLFSKPVSALDFARFLQPEKPED